VVIGILDTPIIEPEPVGRVVMYCAVLDELRPAHTIRTKPASGYCNETIVFLLAGLFQKSMRKQMLLASHELFLQFGKY